MWPGSTVKRPRHLTVLQFSYLAALVAQLLEKGHEKLEVKGSNPGHGCTFLSYKLLKQPM